MTQPVSPLSGSADLELLEEIPARDLVSIYRRILEVDVASEFRGVDTLRLYRDRESDLRFFHPAVAGSEQFYEQLQKFDWYYPGFKTEYDFAARYVAAGDRVLDVGCGVAAFSKIVPDADYTGLELSRAAKEKAEGEGIRVLNEFAEDHARQNAERYDVVCAFQLLEHLVSPVAFLEACLECLRPGGTLVLSVPSVDSFSSMIVNFALDLPPHHVTRWTDEALRNLPRYAPMEHLETWHEPLPADQVSLYRSETIRWAILGRLGKRRAVDTRLRVRAAGLLSRIIAKAIGSGISEKRLGLRGVFAAAAYRKPSR